MQAIPGIQQATVQGVQTAMQALPAAQGAIRAVQASQAAVPAVQSVSQALGSQVQTLTPQVQSASQALQNLAPQVQSSGSAAQSVPGMQMMSGGIQGSAQVVPQIAAQASTDNAKPSTPIQPQQANFSATPNLIGQSTDNMSQSAAGTPVMQSQPSQPFIPGQSEAPVLPVSTTSIVTSVTQPLSASEMMRAIAGGALTTKTVASSPKTVRETIMQSNKGQSKSDLVQSDRSQGEIPLSQIQPTSVQAQLSQSSTLAMQLQGQFSQGLTQESQSQNIQTQGQVPQGKNQTGREFKERVPFFEQLENTLHTISGRNTPVSATQSPARVSAITTTVQSTQPTMSVRQSEATISGQSQTSSVQPMEIDEKSTDSEDLQIIGFQESPLKDQADLQQQNLNVKSQLQQKILANQIGGSVQQSEPSSQPKTIAHAMDSLIRQQLSKPTLSASPTPTPGSKPNSGTSTPILTQLGATPASTPGSKPCSGSSTPLQLTATGMTMSQVMDQLTGKTQGNLVVKSGKWQCLY